MHNPVRFSGTFHVSPARNAIGTPEVFRVLDWTNLDAPPTSMDVARLATLGNTARVAILVNTPRMLRAANTFSEQAGLHGVQVRVFIDSAEALTWLYKPLPQGMPKA